MIGPTRLPGHARNCLIVVLASGQLTTSGCSVGYFAELAIVLEQYDGVVARAVGALPSGSARVVNETDEDVIVYLTSAIDQPRVPGPLGPLRPLYTDPEYMESAGRRVVRVPARGTADRQFKCGDLLGISALTDSALLDDYWFLYEDTSYVSGISINGGNVSFSGAGAPSPDGGFAGDVINTVWYIRPATDGLDCATGTVVVRIKTAGEVPVVDDETNEIVALGIPGTAEVTIE